MDLSGLPRKRISLEMGHGGVAINGITYVDHENCFMTHSETGTWEIWEITNASGMDHPFHHHTNSAQVLSISGGDAGYRSLYTTTPAWKDVTIVPRMGSVELLMPVMDYAGMAMIHCHIIEHEDIGMMGVLAHHGGNGVTPGASAPLPDVRAILLLPRPAVWVNRPGWGVLSTLGPSVGVNNGEITTQGYGRRAMSWVTLAMPSNRGRANLS